MSGISDIFNVVQLNTMSAQSKLENLRQPDTTLEQLRTFQETLKSLSKELKTVSSKINIDRSEQKPIWLRRIQATYQEYYDMKNQFNTLSENKMRTVNKNELLSGRNYNNGISDVETALMSENEAVSRSTAAADYYLELGKSSMSNLYDQGNTMKRTKRRMLDIANYFGLTDKVIHNAMSRSWWDRCLVFSGIIIITIGLFFVWYIKKH